MNYISLSRNFLPLQGKIFRDKFLCYERLIFSSVLEIIIIQNWCQIVLIFPETFFKCSKEYLNYLSRWRCSDQSTHRRMFTITMEAAMFYLLDKSYTQLDFRVSVKSIPGRGNKENFRCLSGMGVFCGLTVVFSNTMPDMESALCQRKTLLHFFHCTPLLVCFALQQKETMMIVHNLRVFVH